MRLHWFAFWLAIQLACRDVRHEMMFRQSQAQTGDLGDGEQGLRVQDAFEPCLVLDDERRTVYLQ